MPLFELEIILQPLVNFVKFVELLVQVSLLLLVLLDYLVQCFYFILVLDGMCHDSFLHNRVKFRLELLIGLMLFLETHI